MKTWKDRVLLVSLAVALGACGGESSSTIIDKPIEGVDEQHSRHPDVVPLYVEMTTADLKELYRRDVRSDEILPATVKLSPEGPELDVRGLRFRGSTTRDYPKKSFNIRLEERPEIDEFPEFNFRSAKRGAGNRIVLNASWTDPSGMREALNFGMYEALGLPASQTFYADLYINNIYEGLYVGIERIDREALRGWGLHRKEGEFTLVRDQSKANRHLAEIKDRSIFGFNMDSVLSTDEERIELLQEVFDYRGELEETDWAGLLELIRWSHATPAGARWESEFAERFDLESFVDFLAIHVLTHDRDSLDIDFWLYRDESKDAADPRWKFIPWDKNLTFGSHYFGGILGSNDYFDYDMSFVETMGNALVIKSMQTAGIRARLHERLRELMAETFSLDYFREKIAGYRPVIEPSLERLPSKYAYVLHPGQHHGEAGFLGEHLDSLLDFVELRYQYIGRQIDSISGAAYETDYVIEDGKKGDVVFLTDAKGWTIARLELSTDVERAEISARVEEKSGLDGVDRIWTIEVAGGKSVEGDLSLYYRNTPVENWYAKLEAIGRQRELVIARVDGEGALETLDSRVNPYSNRVEATVELSGRRQFVVVH